MSYIESLKLIQASIPVDLNNFSEKNAVKIEKLLKVQKQLDEAFNGISIDLFIKSFREYKEGIVFLTNNPNLERLLMNDLFFKKKQKVIFKEEDEAKIKRFFKLYLLEDITNSCNVAFAKEQYGIVNELLHYRLFLPEEIIHLIEKKTDAKAEYFLNIADKVVKTPSILKNSFSTLVASLNEKEIKGKMRKLNTLTTSYSRKALSRSGLAHFCYTLIDGLFWMGNTPKTVEDKIEKQEVLRDFRFMMGILGGICILVISVVVFANQYKNKIKAKNQIVANLKFDKSVYGYLTDFDATKVSGITYLAGINSGKFNTQYSGKKPRPHGLLKSAKIVNNSSYEILILPDKESVESLDIRPHTFYIKPKDSINAKLLFNRIYIGRDLALFKDYPENKIKYKFHKRYTKDKLPRFLHPISLAKEIIAKRFEINGDIEFFEKENKLYVRSEKMFSVYSTNNEYVRSYFLSTLK